MRDLTLRPVELVRAVMMTGAISDAGQGPKHAMRGRFPRP